MTDLTLKAVAAMCGVCPKIARRWIHLKMLVAERVKSGQRGAPAFRVKPADLLAFARRYGLFTVVEELEGA